MADLETKTAEVLELWRACLAGMRDLQNMGVENEIQMTSQSGHAIIITYPSLLTDAKSSPTKVLFNFPTPEKIDARKKNPITSILSADL